MCARNWKRVAQLGRIWSRGESQQRWRRRHFIVTRRGADNGLAGLRQASRHGLGAHLRVALKARGLVTRRSTEVLGVDGGQVEQRAVVVVSSGRGPCLLASRRGLDGAPVREVGLATASCDVRLPLPSRRTPSFQDGRSLKDKLTCGFHTSASDVNGAAGCFSHTKDTYMYTA